MPIDRPAKTSFWVRRRLYIQIASVLLFLPPLALILQLSTGDTNFCGTWCMRMFWAIRKGTEAHAIWIGVLRAIVGATLLVTILVTTWFFGRLWCSHLCPVGSAGEVLGRLLPKRFKIDYSFVPAPAFRYGYLAVYIAAPLLGFGSLCCNYCNFATVPRLFGAAFNHADLLYFFRIAGLINLALFILLTVLSVGGRAYCNLLCPIGALDSLSSWLGARFGRRVRVNEGSCTGCKVCASVCPTWSIKTNSAVQIDHSSCLGCRQCELICPKGAIVYGVLKTKS